MKLKKHIVKEKGSITLYTLISIMVLIILLMGLYFKTNNKIQKQEKEIEKIQQEYEKEDIEDVYEETKNTYSNAETPTIEYYSNNELKGTVIGEKISSKKTIYVPTEKISLKFLSEKENDSYYYSSIPNGEKTKINGNTLGMNVTTDGVTIYTYIEDANKYMSKYYTGITAKLVTMQDKTIYVPEGEKVNVGEIAGVNVGNITYGETENNEIATIKGDEVTGEKAGDTKLTVTESNAGQQCTITVKVVKLELAQISGTTLLGEEKTIEISGINNGTITAEVEDSSIAKANISGNILTVIPQKEGNTKITIKESNANASATYDIKVANVALTPNSGIYTMPTTGKARVESTVVATNAEKIEVMWSGSNGTWQEIKNNEKVTKTDCENGTYKLYVRINEEAIYQSKEFIVGENTLETNKITIIPSTTDWTNENITATVTYGSTLTQNKKVAFGTDLTNAQNLANITNITVSETTVPISENGYIYAEATDTAGNKITKSLPITNIDKKPTVIETELGEKSKTTDSITVSLKAIDEDSGHSKVIWYHKLSSDSDFKNIVDETTPMNGNTKGTTTSVTKEKTITELIPGYTYNVYAEVYDVAGNMKRTPAEGTVNITTEKLEGKINPPTAKTLTYNRTAQELINAATSDTGTVQYKLGEDGTYSTTIPTATNAGTYKVYYKVIGDIHHKDVPEASIDVTIGQYDVSNCTIELSTTAFNWTGNSQIPTATVKHGEVTLSASTEYIVTNPKDSTNAGDKTITITGKGNYTGTKTATYKINKINATMTDPTLATGLTYNRAAQNLLSKEGSAVGGTIKYGLGANSTTAPTTWNTSIIGTNAGTYYVWSKVDADGNHNNVNAKYIGSVTIGQYDVSNCTITLSTTAYNYNGNSQIPTATVKHGEATMAANTEYTVTNPTDSTNVGTKTITITGTGNYKGTNTATYTINAKSVAVNWTNTTKEGNGTAQQPNASAESGVSGETINLSLSGSVTNVGSGTVTASIASVTGGQAKKDNYTLTGASTTFKIVDTTPPEFTSAEIKNIKTTGYDVYVYGLSDNGSGVDRVQFPTWTENAGQDDIQSNWSTSDAAKGTKQSDGTTWVYHVSIADHKKETGVYNTHVYAYDNSGNEKCIYTNKVTVPSIPTPTKITYSTSEWTNGNVTATASTTASGFTIQTSKDNQTWSNTNVQTFTENGTIYARLSDGINVGDILPGNVTNIDKIAPEINITFTETATSAVVKMNASDNVALESIMTSGNKNTITKANNSKELSYDLELENDGETTIRVTDIAGNITEKKHKLKFLFKQYDEKTEITGGWKENYFYQYYGYIYDVYYFKENGLLAITANPTSAAQGRLGTWYTNNAIDFTGYDELRSVSWFNQNSTGNTELWIGGNAVDSDDINTIDKSIVSSDGYWSRLICNLHGKNAAQIAIGTNGQNNQFVQMYLACMYIYSLK